MNTIYNKLTEIMYKNDGKFNPNFTNDISEELYQTLTKMPLTKTDVEEIFHKILLKF